MAQKFCGEMVRLDKDYMSVVGGWTDEDEYGSTEYKVARERLIRRGTMGLAVNVLDGRMLNVLIEGQLWPVARNVLAPVQ